MKVDVKKFLCDHNGSHRYVDWGNNLKRMCEQIGHYPDCSDKKYRWAFSLRNEDVGNYCEKKIQFFVGFDNDGNLFTEFYCYGKYKNKKKTIASKDAVNYVLNKTLEVINIIDKFGYMVHD